MEVAKSYLTPFLFIWDLNIRYLLLLKVEVGDKLTIKRHRAWECAADYGGTSYLVIKEATILIHSEKYL